MKGTALVLCILLSGCLAHGGSLPAADRALVGIERHPPTPSAFTYCSDHNCEVEHPVSLSEEQWAAVTEPLAAAGTDAGAERTALAEVVARYERAVAVQAGTGADEAGTHVFSPPGQLDCVDEAVNTTRLLVMLQNRDLLHFHRALRPIHRSFVGNSRTHMTAVIQEVGGPAYAVDSWFRPSGQPADIVELDLWLQGWEPPDARI